MRNTAKTQTRDVSVADGVCFLTAISFHDAKLVEVRRGEKYGRACLSLLVDFKTAYAPPADGIVYEITFLNGIFVREPKRMKDCYILALDCAAENGRVRMELEYFVGEEARHDVLEIDFSGVEVRKVK